MISFLLIALFVILVVYVANYNRIVSTKQSVSEAWADIDVQLKRRHDLIPNLMETVKGYSVYESAVFKQVVEARSQALAVGQSNLMEKSKAENSLSKNLKSLFAIAEGYPELKANQNYLKLQQELANIEDEIASARRIYNSNVASYNQTVIAFPTNIIAGIHHFQPANFFEDEKSSL